MFHDNMYFYIFYKFLSIIYIVFLFIFKIEQINAEYKVLALQYHPDKNDGNKEAETKFQLLKVTL